MQPSLFLCLPLTMLSGSLNLSMAKDLSRCQKRLQKNQFVGLLSKGEYEFFHTRLTLAERARVKAAQRDPDDANEFALKLLLAKAQKKDGGKMFADGMYAELKNEWPAAELEAAMLLLIAPEEEESVSEDRSEKQEEEYDPKD